MEREMLNKMQRKMKEMSENAAGNLKSLQEAEKNKINLLTKQNQELQELLAAEREKASNKSKEEMDMEAARRREKAMSAEILKLKKEIERIHKSWEKKFGILQASLHALKDESYVRQSLQRQAATLHHAAISYAVDAPLGIQPSKQTPRKFPLPNIPPSGRSTKRDGEYYPHTVSANSARYHSVDENQVVSDPEDVPADMAPLPDPPHSFRPVSSSGDDNIRPSSSNVVVVPSPLQAQ
ncbi:uncharacterized protein LOC135477920 [Liolophura sinensis]|uniref:uncharacterized protein LOC135477920 n=1 Tax=Liolophura sinensis TaxID=3198878 RepID=UPI003158F953